MSERRWDVKENYTADQLQPIIDGIVSNVKYVRTVVTLIAITLLIMLIVVLMKSNIVINRN